MNADAVIGQAGNVNAAELYYSNTNDIITTPNDSTTEKKVYTYGIYLEKLGEGSDRLNGVQFTLTGSGITDINASYTRWDLRQWVACLNVLRCVCMAEEIKKCRCGNEMVSVIMTSRGTTVYCTKCGSSTTRSTREKAVQAWNEKCGRRRWK